MSDIYRDKIKESVEAREQLKKRVLDIILKRCEVNDYGKIQPGSLQQYVWHKLGFKNNVEKQFQLFVSEALLNIGIIKTQWEGHKFYRGLRWKGEENLDWQYPKADDIPKWVNTQLRFRYVIKRGVYSIDRPAGLVSKYD